VRFPLLVTVPVPFRSSVGVPRLELILMSPSVDDWKFKVPEIRTLLVVLAPVIDTLTALPAANPTALTVALTGIFIADSPPVKLAGARVKLPVVDSPVPEKLPTRKPALIRLLIELTAAALVRSRLVTSLGTAVALILLVPPPAPPMLIAEAGLLPVSNITTPPLAVVLTVPTAAAPFVP